MNTTSTHKRHKRNAELDIANEVTRLRTAMVHAMDDCEQALRNPNLPGSARTVVGRAYMALKSALEKK